MPFYLVTYTALVDAEDEVAAAEKVAADLKVEQRMTFTVKRDENSIKHVSVTRRADVPDDRSAEQPVIHAASETPADEPGSGRDDQPSTSGHVAPRSSAGMIGTVLLALSVAACGLFGLFHLTLLRLFQ